MSSSAARNKWRPADGHRGRGVDSIFQRPRMTHLENAVSVTIVRLGKAVPKLFFPSAVDFILPVNCRRSTTSCRPACRGSASGEFILPAVPDAARTAVVDRRQLTGKLKSTALEKNTTGSASPRRTIVPSLATASPRQRHAREHVSNVQRGGG